MDEGKIKKLEGIIKAADLIEACQTKNLISPEDRKGFLETLNGKAHTAIDALLAD